MTVLAKTMLILGPGEISRRLLLRNHAGLRDEQEELLVGKTNRNTQEGTALGSVGRPILIATASALTLMLVALFIILSWASSLPEPIANHWSGMNLVPNGFTNLASFLWLSYGLSAFLVLLAAAFGMTAIKNTAGVRIVVVLIVFMACFIAALTLLVTGIQRGLSDAADALLPGWGVAVAVAVPIALAIVGALLVRRIPTPDADQGPAPDAPVAALKNGSVPVWKGTSSCYPVFIVGAPILILAAFMWISATSDMWWLMGLAVVIAALIPMMSIFSVRIDASGLRVRSWAGWPSATVTARQVRQARALAQIRPLAQFGGWGYRLTFDGTIGFITRKGPGIEVEYGKNEVLVITVNRGSEQAAATLNAAAEQVRATDR